MSSKEQLQVFLQAEAIAAEQMAEIKRVEMSWLRIFLLFYAGLIAWSAARWFGIDPHPLLDPDLHVSIKESLEEKEQWLMSATLVISVLGTVIFSIIFLSVRHSYFGVLTRILAIQKQLLDCWDAFHKLEYEEIYASKGTGVTSLRTWLKTKPGSSFFSRLTYVLAAHFLVMSLVFASNDVGLGLSWSLDGKLFWILLSVLIPIFVYLVDFLVMLKAGSKTK